MTDIEKLTKNTLAKYKKGKLTLTKPIKSADGKEDINEISVADTTDAKFFYSMPLVQEDLGCFKGIIADLTGLTYEQVGSLHIEDYSSLVLRIRTMGN